MKTTLLAAASAAALAFGAQAAFAAGHAECESMLAQSIGLQLSEEGFDASKACSLTLAQLATIKGAMDNDGMNNNTRQLIESILSEAE